ncbi:E7 protein [Felis catus papillomavirus 6]|uniref:Protein E7 n=1 Tax=Felis catus papillomavirus 6 TaxID=2704502 RepID=A0A6B9WAX7_9PAPI|nr:E7 protein [Felis catus papillomavirus 6]
MLVCTGAIQISKRRLARTVQDLHRKMIGVNPSIKDIELDLTELVLPENLLSDESLETEEVEPPPESQAYRILTDCGVCKTTVRLFVLATVGQIRTQQELFLAGLNIICLACCRNLRQHGGPRH